MKESVTAPVKDFEVVGEEAVRGQAQSRDSTSGK